MSWSGIRDYISPLFAQYAWNAVAALLILFVGFYVAKRLHALAITVMQKSELDPTVVGFAGNIAKLVLFILVVIMALTQLGIPTASFIALIGAAGLAIGLALQGSLSNFASGVLLVLFKPCRVGDYIETGSVGGTVEQITVFSTTLITPDKRTITVPNSTVLSGPIINYSTASTRRIDLTISIGYQSDLAVAKTVLADIINKESRVLTSPEPTIGVLTLAPASVDIAVRPWVKTEDFGSVRFSLNEQIKTALGEAGISMAYPLLDVHLTR